MKLYNYFRSSASFRVRIALQLKGLPYDYLSVHLARGDHKKPPFADLSPDGLVPLLDTGTDQLTQSMAIMEYLDETHPAPALLPADALGRARVRALAQSIACEIHPLNNLRVLKYLVGPLGVSEEVTGRALREYARLDEVVIATKVRLKMGDGPNRIGLSRKHIIQSCEDSLRRLGVERIDLYQIHRHHAETPVEETLAALDHLVRQGKVLYLGASSMFAWQLMKALSVSERNGWAKFVSLTRAAGYDDGAGGGEGIRPG